MPLQLSFLNPAVRQLCECRSVAERALGDQAARRLRARLSDISSAEKISEVVAASPTALACGQLVIALSPPHKLVLEPAMTSIPKKGNGDTDWDAIDCFCVVAVD